MYLLQNIKYKNIIILKPIHSESKILITYRYVQLLYIVNSRIFLFFFLGDGFTSY